jgi:DedD protein
MAQQKQQEDVDTLKRRGRRRLVGAVALALLAVIVLPMVFDAEPRKAPPPVSVRIPGEDESAFAPKLPARIAPSPASAPEKANEDKKPAAEAPEKQTNAVGAAAKPADAERARAEAALANAEFEIQVGAFANAKPVEAKLGKAKIRYYTESVATAKGPVTRVRVGPFASKAEAEKALRKLKALDLPGSISTKG